MIKDYKQMFDSYVSTYLRDVDYSSMTDIGLYNKYKEEKDKEISGAYYTAMLLRCWTNLTYMYYHQKYKTFSEEECYDIFMQSFEEVLDRHVWTKEDSSLYNDKDAIKKAMTTTVKCRFMNYQNAQHADKRSINYYASSLDRIEEDSSEGFLMNYNENKNAQMYEGIVSDKIHELFNLKQYESAFILDAIITNDVYNDEGLLDLRKLRKILRNITKQDCKWFSERYNVELEHCLYSLHYFIDSSQSNLDKQIKNTLYLLKADSNIINILR